MTQALHSQARTTHLIREEIRQSTLPQKTLAELYNVSRLTIRKWPNRAGRPRDSATLPTVPNGQLRGRPRWRAMRQRSDLHHRLRLNRHWLRRLIRLFRLQHRDLGRIVQGGLQLLHVDVAGPPSHYHRRHTVSHQIGERARF